MLQLFSDWADMTGYDGEARKALTEWQKTTGKESSPHLCVKSAIVAMGVSMANVVLGNTLDVTSNLATFYKTFSALAPPSVHEALGRFQARDDASFKVQAREVG
jgi:hypothetical protein